MHMIIFLCETVEVFTAFLVLLSKKVLVDYVNDVHSVFFHFFFRTPD